MTRLKTGHAILSSQHSDGSAESNYIDLSIHLIGYSGSEHHLIRDRHSLPTSGLETQIHFSLLVQDFLIPQEITIASKVHATWIEHGYIRTRRDYIRSQTDMDFFLYPAVWSEKLYSRIVIRLARRRVLVETLTVNSQQLEGE